MFEGFKDKMNQFYDDVKNKINGNQRNPNNNQMRVRNNPRPVLPVIRQPNKPNTSFNNSLMNSQINESDLDMKRLENFNLNMSSERSFVVEGAKRVAYYNRREKPKPLQRKGKVTLRKIN
jgi:hypothetical protein